MRVGNESRGPLFTLPVGRIRGALGVVSRSRRAGSMKISFDLFKLGQIERRCHQRTQTAPQQKNPKDEREMHSAAPLRRGILQRQIAALPLEVPRAAPDSMPSGDAQRCNNPYDNCHRCPTNVKIKTTLYGIEQLKFRGHGTLMASSWTFIRPTECCHYKKKAAKN